MYDRSYRTCFNKRAGVRSHLQFGGHRHAPGIGLRFSLWDGSFYPEVSNLFYDDHDPFHNDWTSSWPLHLREPTSTILRGVHDDTTMMIPSHFSITIAVFLSGTALVLCFSNMDCYGGRVRGKSGPGYLLGLLKCKIISIL